MAFKNFGLTDRLPSSGVGSAQDARFLPIVLNTSATTPPFEMAPLILAFAATKTWIQLNFANTFLNFSKLSGFTM
jgi:hypothetical protein